MSTYYILINKSKKEWVDTGDLGFSLSDRAYKLHIANLIGWLYVQQYFDIGDREQYDPNRHKIGVNFTFQGHWAGDMCQIVSEHTKEYAICHGFDDESGINKEIKKWANITIPLVKEWNAECLYWYGDNRPEMTGWLLCNTFDEKKFEKPRPADFDKIEAL
jgi:hypothetical protein